MWNKTACHDPWYHRYPSLALLIGRDERINRLDSHEIRNIIYLDLDSRLLVLKLCFAYEPPGVGGFLFKCISEMKILVGCRAREGTPA